MKNNCIVENTVFYIFAILCSVWLNGSSWVPGQILQSVRPHHKSDSLGSSVHVEWP